MRGRVFNEKLAAIIEIAVADHDGTAPLVGLDDRVTDTVQRLTGSPPRFR
ncbi:hypothetical protein [Mycobacterium sp. HNNTM2301]